MSGTTRRGFLQGMVASVAASSLIIEANEADVAAFGKGQEVNLIGPPPQLGWIASGYVGWSPTRIFRPGDMLFNDKGEPVCVVERVHPPTTEEIQVPQWGESAVIRMRQIAQGIRVTLDVEVMHVK